MEFIDEFYADKNLNALKRVTLIVPTYNRNCYLNRCLIYHSHFPFGEIIVADSSSEEIKSINRENIRRLIEECGSKIQYLEYPPETEKYGGDIYSKWSDAIQHVETEYSLICTDKSFILPLTKCKEIEFLDSNSDYSSAYGIQYSIGYDEKGEIIFFPDKDYCTNLIENTSSNLKERYKSVCNGSVPMLLFAVFRSNIHKEIYSTIENYNLLDIRFKEMLISFLGHISGRNILFTSDIDHCRDITQLSYLKKLDKSESSSLRYPQITDYIQDGSIDHFSAPFIQCLKETLQVKNPSISYEELENMTKFDFQKGLYNYQLKQGLLYCIIQNNAILKKIWEIFPRSLKLFIKNLAGYNDKKRAPANISEELNVIDLIIKNPFETYESG